MRIDVQYNINIKKKCQSKEVKANETATMAQQNIEKVSHAETQHLFVLPILKVPLKQMTESQLRLFLPNMLMYSMGSVEMNWKNESKKPPWWPSDVQWANIWTDEKSDSSLQTINNRMIDLQKVVTSCYQYHGRQDQLAIADKQQIHKGDIQDNRNPLNILDRTNEFDTICRLCLSNATATVVDIFSFYDDEEIASIVSQHFWFQIFKGDGQSDRLCTNCWVAIEGFHKFFKEVQQIHNSQPETFAKIQQIKEEAEENISDTASETALEEQIPNIHIPYDVIGSESLTPKVEKFFETGYDAFEENDISHIQPICTYPKGEPNDGYLNEKSMNGIPLQNDTTYEITTFHPPVTAEPLMPENTFEEDEYIRQIFNMKCRYCSYEFEKFDEVKEHYWTVHYNRDAYLVCCQKRFRIREKALRHCIAVHLNSNPMVKSEEIFECKICDRKFGNNRRLIKHNDMHHSGNAKKFACTLCDEKFHIARALKEHHTLRHENKSFSCEYCHKVFPLQKRLLRHTRNIHEKFGYTCDICGQLFKTKSLLGTHRLTHTDKPKRMEKIQCRICEKWISNKYEMKRHLYRHEMAETGTTKICSICNKEFANQLKLKCHMVRIHRDKTHKCKECGKSFKMAKCLKEHMALHTGEDLYKCPYCARTFKSNANMYNHRKKMHVEEWTRDREQNIFREYKLTK